MMPLKNGKIVGQLNLLGQNLKWLTMCWYLSTTQCVKQLQVGLNTLCLNVTILKNTWGSNKQTMTFLANGWRKMRYTMTRKTNMFKILPCSTFNNLCLFYSKLVMLMLGRINARLFSLLLFFLCFGKWFTHGWVWIFETFIWNFESNKFA